MRACREREREREIYNLIYQYSLGGKGFQDLGTIWIERKEGKGKERIPMEKKGKESGGKWFTFILFGLYVERKKGNTGFLFGLRKEKKGKEKIKC